MMLLCVTRQQTFHGQHLVTGLVLEGGAGQQRQQQHHVPKRELAELDLDLLSKNVGGDCVF